MSFIKDNANATVYAPGWFLADAEKCTRETMTIDDSHANVQTTADGKYLPMGSIFPSNDGNAMGITYEDVDVTTGDMPGSVVTKGVVYEDRLAKTGVTYDAATSTTGKNPKAEGWYERSGSSPNYTYTLSTDTTVSDQKTYYIQSDVTISSAAKSALEALGFVFKTAPTVTRPY
jgi:hypothetical protein